MTPTDEARESFRSDHILIDEGRIRIYWYRDFNGKWFSSDGGPLKGDIAVRAAKRLTQRIIKYRDLLPRGCQNLPIELGEMDAHGRFTLKKRIKKCLPECQK